MTSPIGGYVETGRSPTAAGQADTEARKYTAVDFARGE
jgi:hypothetical protein